MRKISLLLCMMMVTVFASCGEKQDDSKTTTAPEQTSLVTENPEAGQEEETLEENSDEDLADEELLENELNSFSEEDFTNAVDV